MAKMYKVRRREEAMKRQELYNQLTVAQKIAKLGSHTAKKQRARLAGEKS